jgi:hypothetical protein
VTNSYLRRPRIRSGLVAFIRSWGDEHVVLDIVSGDTHLVRDEALQVISQVAETGARPDPALAARLAAHKIGESKVLSIAEREALNNQLSKLGLIERVTQ